MGTRKIVEIDEERCNGCGLCVPNCAEGAIRIVNGKAKLLAENLCDGLGACLGECPEGAIRIIEREADAFDEAAVAAHLAPKAPAPPVHAGCPGNRMQQFQRPAPPVEATGGGAVSQLATWPVQLTLLSPQAPYLRGADLLLVADCVPVAYAGFHGNLLKGQPVVIGCPKLDDARSYVTKLAEIIQTAAPRSLTVAHMEVPCCTGLAQVARLALLEASSELELRTVVIGIRGDVKGDSAGELNAPAFSTTCP